MTDVEAQKGRSRDPARLDGFPSLAHFISEDTDGAIFRKFDSLSARNLLYLQSNVNDLRTRLGELDRSDVDRGSRDTRVRRSAKAYSDLKARARRYQEEKEATLLNSDEAIDANDGENTTGKDAFERIQLHKQIKEAMRDYRKFAPKRVVVGGSC